MPRSRRWDASRAAYRKAGSEICLSQKACCSQFGGRVRSADAARGSAPAFGVGPFRPPPIVSFLKRSPSLRGRPLDAKPPACGLPPRPGGETPVLGGCAVRMAPPSEECFHRECPVRGLLRCVGGVSWKTGPFPETSLHSRQNAGDAKGRAGCPGVNQPKNCASGDS